MSGLTFDAGALIALERGDRRVVARTSDVVDASVVACAWTHGHAVVTADAKDLRRIDRELPVVAL